MRNIIILIILLVITDNTSANSCKNQLVDGVVPLVVNKQVINEKTLLLCFDEMTLLHSSYTRTALWSAALLTRERVENGKALSREDNFHEEEAIPASDRSTLNDYRGSMRFNLQRGHLVANKDTSTRKAQYESFSLANTIPQNGDSNGKLWNEIEQRVRGMAMQQGALYVVTGPIFDDSSDRLNGRVLIPKRLFKAIYDPKAKQASAYLATNTDGWDYRVVSIKELTDIIGIDVFPSLSKAIKNQVLSLPVIRARKQKKFISDVP